MRFSQTWQHSLRIIREAPLEQIKISVSSAMQTEEDLEGHGCRPAKRLELTRFLSIVLDVTAMAKI